MLDPARAGKTTASMAPIIVHGSGAERYQLWLERTGQSPPPDFSKNFAVQLGRFLETFCLDWVERVTRIEITERQRFVQHPTLPNISATLDGYRAHDDAVIEHKVLNAFAEPETKGGTIGFKDYYSPQVAVQAACRGASNGILSVQRGVGEPQLFELLLPASYQNQVLEQLVAFQHYVETMTPPGPAPAAPVPPERWRSLDLSAMELPNWGHALKPQLDLWRETRGIWKQHEETKTAVKAILPDDVGRVTHGTITIRRNKSGAVTITEEAA